MERATSPTQRSMGRPPRVTRPQVGTSRPVRTRESVVFPDPLSPVMSMACPGSRIRLTSRRTGFSQGVPRS